MKRSLSLALVLVLVSAVFVFAQDSQSEFFRSSFESAEFEVKQELVNRAVRNPTEELGPFFQDVLRFVVDNAALLPSDVKLQNMARTAIVAVVQVNYGPAARAVWDVFEVYTETTSRVQILDAMELLGQDNNDVVTLVNRWLNNRNVFRRGGGRPDLQVVQSAVETLGALGDSRSFNVLVDARIVQYSSAISEAAEIAMDSLESPVAELITDAIENSEIPRKRELFDLALDLDILAAEQKRHVALAVVDDALFATPSSFGDESTLRRLRVDAAATLLENETAETTPILVDHFNRTYLEYDRGLVVKGALLEAIELLGGTGTEAAANRLGRYLQLLNSYTENDRPYDTQIMLAVLDNLRELGYRSVYNTVFYVTLLEYPSRVLDAANETLEALNR